MPRPLKTALLLLLTVAAFAYARSRAAFADAGDKSALAGFVSRLLSSPGSKVSIGAVDGALSSNAMIRDVTLADSQGTWLTIDRIKIAWTRSALLSRRLQVDDLEIGRVDVLRRPVAKASNSPRPSLPGLPVKVVVKNFRLADLRLEQPVLGASADVTASGQASLGDPRQGLDLTFEAHRTDAPGSLALRLTFAPDSQKLTVALDAHEASGGLAARLLNLPGAPAVALGVHADGVLDDLRGVLSLAAGPDLAAHGDLRLTRDGAARSLILSLSARLEALAPVTLRSFFAGESRLEADLRIGANGSVDLKHVAATANGAKLTARGRVGTGGGVDVEATFDASPDRGPFVGTLHSQFRLHGQTGDLSLEGRVASAKAVVFGRTATDASADFVIRDGASLAATAHFAGRALGRAISGSLAAERDADGAWRLAPFALEYGRSSLEGALTVSPDRLLAGKLVLARGDLRDFSQILNEKLAGDAQARVDFAVVAGRQTARVQGKLANLRGFGLAAADARFAADLSGSLARPSGDWRLDMRQLATAGAPAQRTPPVDVQARGVLVDGGSKLSAEVSAGPKSTIRVAGFAPFGTKGGIDLRASGLLDAKLAARLLPDGDSLSGRAKVDLSIKGARDRPSVAGDLTLEDGAASDVVSGLRLSNVSAHLSARGDEISIQSFAARTKNGGTILASGAIGLDREHGFPGRVKIVGRDVGAELRSLASARADFNLDVEGPFARGPSVSGRVRLLSMEVQVPDRLPARLQPLPGTTHVAPGPAASRMLAYLRRRAAARRAPPIKATLNLDVVADDRIFVRGRGLDAEFGGRLHLAGDLMKPVLEGAFDLRRGALDFLGKHFDLTKGRFAFSGGFVPDVAVEAEASTASLTAQIEVKGRADSLVFSISSTPELPQDEILSQILFARPAGGLSPFQLVQLANAAAQLSGRTNYLGALDSVRRTLGVDSLTLQSDASGNPTLGVARDLNDRLSVGVTSGAKQQDDAASVNFYLSKHLRAQGQIGADGSSAVGLGMQWNY